MNIVELLAQYRFESSDDTAPYFLSDANCLNLFNDAEEEACRRKALIFDATTEAVCRVAVTSAAATYAKHSSIVAVLTAYLADAAGIVYPLDVVSRDELTRVDPEWRENTGDPEYLIIDGTTMQITPPPTVSFTMFLEVQRTPLVKMALPVSPVPDPPPDPLIDSPEIAPEHHRFLCLWVLHKHYLRPDPDSINPSLGKECERQFTEYFGPRRSADQDKLWREDMLIRNNVTL